MHSSSRAADASNVPPLLARAEKIHQLEKGQLSFEPHDAVEFRDQLQSGLIAETGEVPAHGVVAVDAAVAQVADESTEAVDVELKDQRKADEDRLERPHRFQDVRVVLLEIEHLDPIAVTAQRRRQVAEAEILLVAESNQLIKSV